MKNDLTCAVTRDLLPSYVEGLTAPETNQAVEAHLSTCSECAALREALASPTEEDPQAAREVDYLKKVKRRGWKRAALAVLCTAAVLAYIVAVLGSRTVGVGGPVPLIARGIASLFRNIPVVAWAFILLFSFKQSEFTGFFALFLTSFGYLTRCFLESIDEMGSGPVEALRAAGATYGQIVAQAVIPMSITSVVSWVLYMIETNIRDATLIGLLTGTGIGFVFDVYYKRFRYDVAGLVILAIILAVVACELTSNFVRRRIL